MKDATRQPQSHGQWTAEPLYVGLQPGQSFWPGDLPEQEDLPGVMGLQWGQGLGGKNDSAQSGVTK